MLPLITALAAGRTTRPTAGSTVGARRRAPTPTASPVTVLPLKRSSTNAIVTSPYQNRPLHDAYVTITLGWADDPGCRDFVSCCNSVSTMTGVISADDWRSGWSE